MDSLAAAETTREQFWGFSTGVQIAWYVLATISVVVFFYGVAREVAKYRRGHAAFLPSRRELWPRVLTATRTLVSHSSIKKRDPYVGWAHRAIFYGWIVLFAGTIVLAINTDITERLFHWRFFQGDFYLAYSLILDVLGFALVLGLAMMMVRRGILRPRPRLDYARPDRAPGDPGQGRTAYRVGDWVFVGLLLYLAVTGYLLEGARIAMDSPGYDQFSPVGWVTAQLYHPLGLGAGALGGIRRAIWWSHGLVAIAFVAAIPYTKATHMLSSWLSLILKDEHAGKRLRVIPEARSHDPAGYGSLSDFSVTHLLQLDACTRCGKCHEVCPARATGRPLSPRDVVLELREQSNAALSGRGIGGVLGLMLGGSDGHTASSIVGEGKIRSETAWACMQCNACVEICPVGIEQAPIINEIRRHLVEEGDLDANLQATLQVIHRSGNSFAESKRKRGRWTAELDFQVKDAREEPVELLWFVGDFASFDPRSQRVTRSLARLLRAADVDFGILYDGERNAGNDVRRVGEEGLFEELAHENIAAITGCDFDRILTTDPHSLNTLRNEYCDLGADRWTVMHHTELLLDLIETARLDILHRLPYRVTYHDPCHLGRFNGEYDAPRHILELTGCELREMPRNRDNSFCCGAGGGRIWIPDAPGCERPSENRIVEALTLGEDLDYFVVSCPKDVTMYEDAIKTTNSVDRIELREITELVAEAVSA